MADESDVNLLDFDDSETAIDYGHRLFLRWFYTIVPESDLQTAEKWEHTIGWLVLLLFFISIVCCFTLWDRLSRLRRLMVVILMWLAALATLIFLL